MYPLAKEYNENDNADLELHEDDLNEFENHRTKRFNCKSKTYNGQEAKEIICNSKLKI